MILVLCELKSCLYFFQKNSSDIRKRVKATKCIIVLCNNSGPIAAVWEICAVSTQHVLRKQSFKTLLQQGIHYSFLKC